jgi:RTX calcium-binding nonapeptide repeat (4 copies)
VPVGALVADGGPGDDHLEGGPNNDQLDGGGGRDELLGGDSQDVLTDGDLDGTAGDAAPGPDLLDGGPGQDEISYAQRTAAVIVDLVDPAGDGEPGEGDTLVGFERITGGEGNDRLAGNGLGNTLDGGPGRNRLIGRGGDDELRRFGARGSVSCGRGADFVFDVRPSNFIEPACERVVAGRGRLRLDFGAYPIRTGGGRLGFRVRCPFDEASDQFLVCSGRLALREATGRHRLLAQATIPRSSRSRVVRIRLTALGRTLATRRGGVRAGLAIRGANLPTAGWTIRFAAPR